MSHNNVRFSKTSKLLWPTCTVVLVLVLVLPKPTRAQTENTAYGTGALNSNGGSDNSAFGWYALFADSTGDYNTAVGDGALYSNSTGNRNTAVGQGALQYNNASNETAVGNGALYSNTTGSGNTAVGQGALQYNNASNGTAVGSGALYSNTTGVDNAAFGYLALYSNTTGGNNTAIGGKALYSNVNTNYNTATGYGTLYLNTSGNGNTADGFKALLSNVNGGSNTAVGDAALYSNIGGYYNTAVGEGALYSNKNGSQLTCVGFSCTVSADALHNATAIGAYASVGQSDSLVLGGTGEHAVMVGIGTTTPSSILTVGRGAGHPVSDSWETYSSRRWKKNIHPLENALSKVEQLRGVSYDLKDSGKHEIGVIAEEVGQVVPEVVSYEKNGKDATGVDYSRLTALLIEAVKQQQALVRNQQAQIVRLTSQVKAIRASLKTNGRTGLEVRTAKAQGPAVSQPAINQ